MEAIINNDETIAGALSKFPKAQWPRLVRAFTCYGIEVLKRTYSLPELTLGDIEKIARSNNAEAQQDSSLQMFMKEIESIKESLHTLDKKIEGTIKPKKHKKESKPEPKVPHQLPEQPQKTTSIYPSWWGPPDSTRISEAMYHTKQNPILEGSRKLEADEQYRHELEVTAVAAENARMNSVMARRNPVKMVFEKQEFRGAQIHHKPHPVIIEKRRKGQIKGAPYAEGEDAIPELRQSQSKFFTSTGYKENDAMRGNEETSNRAVATEEKQKKRAESMVEFADNCMSSEIINHFSRDMIESHAEPSQSRRTEENEAPVNPEPTSNERDDEYHDQSLGPHDVQPDNPQPEEAEAGVSRGDERDIDEQAHSHSYTYVSGAGEVHRKREEGDDQAAEFLPSHSGAYESRAEENRKEFTLGDNGYVYDPNS